MRQLGKPVAAQEQAQLVLELRPSSHTRSHAFGQLFLIASLIEQGELRKRVASRETSSSQPESLGSQLVVHQLNEIRRPTRALRLLAHGQRNEGARLGHRAPASLAPAMDRLRRRRIRGASAMSADEPLYRRDPEAWQQHLAEGNAKQPRKRVGADAILRDSYGRILLVDPDYKPDWDLPGGMVEANEPPVGRSHPGAERRAQPRLADKPTNAALHRLGITPRPLGRLPDVHLRRRTSHSRTDLPPQTEPRRTDTIRLPHAAERSNDSGPTSGSVSKRPSRPTSPDSRLPPRRPSSLTEPLTVQCRVDRTPEVPAIEVRAWNNGAYHRSGSDTRSSSASRTAIASSIRRRKNTVLTAR